MRLQHIIVISHSQCCFSGDSYSSVDDFQTTVKPDADKPLGVPFPGVTWNEPQRPNWVGHLLTKYCPEPRYRPSDGANYGKCRYFPDRSIYTNSFPHFQDCPVGDKEAQDAWAKSPLLVHDYAKGGDRVPGVRHQIQDLFLPGVGTKPSWAAWTATETLFGECLFSSPTI